MLCQNFLITYKNAEGLHYAPYVVTKATELLYLISEQLCYLDLEYSKIRNVLVFSGGSWDFKYNEYGPKIITKHEQRIDSGTGMITWDIEYNEEMVTAFYNLILKWEMLPHYFNTLAEFVEIYGEQINLLLGDFKSINNIELVIQLLDSLMS